MFSGASTPQRTTRRSARSSRAPSAFGLGSTPAPSGSPAPSTLHGRTLGSNLAPASHSRALSASPVPPSRARSAAARSAVAVSEVGSAMMDVDGGGGQHREQRDDKVLVKDEHYSITERKNLPLDVRRVVDASGQFPFEICQHFEFLLTSNCLQTPTRDQSKVRLIPSRALDSLSAASGATFGTPPA